MTAWLLLTMAYLGAVERVHAADFNKDARPLIVKYCGSCHSEAKKEGNLNLVRIDKPGEVLEAVLTWETVVKRMTAKEMPPEGSPQPSPEELARFFAWHKTLPKPTDNCKTLASDQTQNFYQGYVMSRRLTRTEYNYAVRDLFGIDLRPADAFPSDGSGGEGFDTVGASLFTSAILAEKYLEAAVQVIEQVLPRHDRRPEAGARRQILFVQPQPQQSPVETARVIVTRFAERAYRRPVTAEDLDPLMKLFARGHERGDSLEDALRLPLSGILLSPHFLYLAEPEPPEEGVHRLEPFPLATRLSFFLWSSLPDEELWQLAATRKLHDDAVLKQQVQRMLRDPKSRALGENFGLQWLGLTAFGGASRPDPKQFPEFTDELAAAMREETIRTIAAVFQENRPLRELLDSDSVVVNRTLARHYGLVEAERLGTDFERVSLGNRQRGGLLTQAAVLTTTSYPLRTSPVLRGRWLLEEVLGSKVPPPPPNVPALAEAEAGSPQSLRERLELHRTKSECAACHSRMDPLGFGLENFDAIGRWRERDGTVAIDSSGQLPSGERFAGPEELKQLLLRRKGEVYRHLTRKLLGYALGRELNKFDQCAIDDSLKALQAGDDRAAILCEQIVLSYPFQHRYTKK